VSEAPRKSSGVVEKAVDVLVVEDDHDSRRMLEALFTTHGCLVRAVATSEEAFKSALERLPDVVVADLELPGGSPGWTLAQELRENLRTRNVGLIAVTGRVEPRVEVVTPFDAYLRKPVDVRLLLDLVDELAEMSRAQRRHAHDARNG
jgi:CheY-like chemotaxis protein